MAKNVNEKVVAEVEATEIKNNEVQANAEAKAEVVAKIEKKGFHPVQFVKNWLLEKNEAKAAVLSAKVAMKKDKNESTILAYKTAKAQLAKVEAKLWVPVGIGLISVAGILRIIAAVKSGKSDDEIDVTYDEVGDDNNVEAGDAEEALSDEE